MENITINHQLVAQITSLVQAWTTADRRIREMFNGWEQRAMRAGLERGFYIEIAQIPGAEIMAGDVDDLEQAGRIVYAAYQRGAVTAALDTL